MTEDEFDRSRDEVMPLLSRGLNETLMGIYGREIEFVLVLMLPYEDYLQCSTLTSIKNINRMRIIAKHLNDMADADEKKAPGLNLDDDTDIQGHS